MVEEVQNPLTSLMKRRYGITRQSSLTITDKDNLFSEFRKVANYIYRNGDWTESDRSDAIKSYLQNSGRMAKVDSVKRALPNSFPGSHGDVFEVIGEEYEGKPTTRYFDLDTDNKSWSRQGTRWRIRGSDTIYWTGNMNYTIGYGKLLDNVLKNFYKDNIKLASNLSVDEFKYYLRDLTRYKGDTPGKSLIGSLSHDEFMEATETDSSYPHARKLSTKFLASHPAFEKRFGSGEHYLYEDYHKKQRTEFLAADYLERYLNQTFNIIRQQRYENDINRQTHAKSWETKKNINKATKAIMEKTQLHKWFETVELDNDVDLKQFATFETEMKRLMDKLPRGTETPTLRLRKLGNHHAAGLYVSPLDTLVVDFRKPSEVYSEVDEKSNEQGGFSSFIHEYGHYLDYTLTKGIPLSLRSDFYNIQNTYMKNLRELNSKRNKKLSSKEVAYYSVPSEIFARAFEIYAAESGLRGNLSNNDFNKIDYQAFNDVLRDKIDGYFNNFSEFREMRQKINIDTSIDYNKQRIQPDERQNAVELKDFKKLSEFSKDILHKWTSTPERLEALISATGKMLSQDNPTRIIAFDKWQSKCPRLVSQHSLNKAGINMKKYSEVSYIQGFTRENNQWKSERLYNLRELQDATWSNMRDYVRISKIVPSQKENLYFTDRTAANQVISQVIPDKEGAEKTEKLALKISRHILIDASSHLDGQHLNKPFKFTDSERKLVADLPDILKSQLYLTAANLARGKRRDVAQRILKLRNQQKPLQIETAARKLER